VIDTGVRALPFPVDEDSDIELSVADADANRWLTEWVSATSWVSNLGTADREQIRSAVRTALGEDARLAERLGRSFDLVAVGVIPLGACLTAAYAQWRLAQVRWDLGLSWQTFAAPVLVLLAVAAAILTVAILVRPTFLDTSHEWSDSLDIHATPGLLRRVSSWLLRLVAAAGLTVGLVVTADRVLPGGVVEVPLVAPVALVAAVVGAVTMVLLLAGGVRVAELLHRGRDPRVQLVVDLSWLVGVAAAGSGTDRADLRDGVATHLGTKALWRTDRRARREFAVMFGAAAARVEAELPRLAPRSQVIARRRLRTTAASIAATLRRHGHQVALGGLESDHRLGAALADGLRSACWGRWESLAVAPAPSQVGQIVRRLLPRVLVAAVLVLAAIGVPYVAPAVADSGPDLQIVLVVVAVLLLSGMPQAAAARAIELFGRRIAASAGVARP